MGKKPKPDPKLKSGGCLCGKVRFQATLNGLHFHVCHCDRCRKWNGGPAFGAPANKLEFESADTPNTYSSSSHGERLFCASCGTQMAWRMKNGATAVIWLGALDDSDDLTFENELFFDSKPEHYDFANETLKLTGAEMRALYAGRKG